MIVLIAKAGSHRPFKLIMQIFPRVSLWILATLTVLVCHQVTNSLGELVSLSDCTCPGYELKLWCTVTGIGFIEWSGTVFSEECTINFRISRFESGKRGESCNDGSIVGHWIERHGPNYTSQLTILVNSTMAGKTIDCVHIDPLHDIGDIIIGEHTITLTDHPFKPPSDVRIVGVGLQALTFDWNQTKNQSCDAIHYSTLATGCGACPNSTSNTSTTCTDVTLSPNSTMLCSFSVQPVVCGSIVGNTSNTAFIMLKSPGTPSFKRLIPYYSRTSKMLIKLETEITLDSVTNGTEVLSNATFYTVNVYSDGISCASAEIPTSSCVMKSCIHVIDLVNNNSCLVNSSQNLIIVKTFASNFFGRGLQSVPMGVETKNTDFDVEFDFVKGIIHCHFFTGDWVLLGKANKSCSLMYGVMQNFDNCTNSLRNRNTSIENFTISNQDSVTIHFTQVSTDDLVYCFIAKGSVRMKTIAIEGTFKWGRKTSSAQDILIPTISCVLVILVILIMIIIVSGVIVIIRWKRYQPASSTEQNIYVSFTGPEKHSTGEMIYADIQPCLSEVQTVTLDDDAVVYAEVNHELSLVDKPVAIGNSQQQTCISKQSEDGHIQDADNMKQQASTSLPNLGNLLAKLHSITHLWYQFGLAVGISQNVLDSYVELPHDKCLIEVLNYWLTNHHSKPTWQDVTRALNEMQLFHLAESTPNEHQTDARE